MNPRLDLSAHIETLVREVTEQVFRVLAPVIREKVDEIVQEAMLSSYRRHTEEMGKHVHAVARVAGSDPYVPAEPKLARKTPDLVLEMVKTLPAAECTISRVISKICATGEFKENTVYRAISRMIESEKLVRIGTEHLSIARR